MRSLRFSLAAACVLGIAPIAVGAQNSKPPTPKVMLSLRPILKGVEYELVPDQAVESCKVETVYIGQRPAGYALRDAQGKMLRRFVDSRGKGPMDQWSYYQDGFEVYRETDLDGDKSPDECRWLNTGGTRVAKVSRGKINGWKQISAEEASKVLVQAIVSGDVDLLESVLVKAEELAELGVPKVETERVAQAATKRREQIKTLQQSVVALGWNKTTVWNRLDGMMPHLIPADPGSGLKSDLTLYENAVIFAGPANATANPGKMAFLQAPEMIKIGETWKFIALPKAIDPEKPVVTSDEGLRASLMRDQGPGGASPNDPPQFAKAKQDLAKFTTDNAQLLTTGKKEDLARYHVDIIPFLRECVKHASKESEKLAFEKQTIDSLAAAYQTGFYPKGAELLDNFKAKGPELEGYAAYSRLSADFARRNEENPGELLANQKKWMDDLKSFVTKYAECEKVPDALYNLAAGLEFLAEEDEARKYYTQLKDQFAESDMGKKAAGALRRLDLVGKTLELKGTGLDKGAIDLAQYKGKAVLIAFWASWAEPVKRDLPELLKVYNKNKSRGFEIIGVNLDSDRKELEAFLKENKLPWPEIHEEGGMDSPLAVEYGIISLPTMILVDPEGRVANRNIRMASEIEKQLDKVLTTKQGGGVAFGDR
jgi:thiol-disulfide isomerase/thioredoxin